MKKYFIVLALLMMPSLSFSKQLPAGDIYSIKNIYKSSRSNNMVDIALFYAVTRGVVDSALFVSDFINKNKEQTKCIEQKDLVSWSEFAFDEYKKNNFTSEVPYTLVLYLIIQELCPNKK